MRSQLAALIVVGICGTILTFRYFDRSSDESILRTEFNIPRAAQVVSYQAHPPENAWMREGLKIDIVFQLNQQDYATYSAKAEQEGLWQPLPIPNQFLLKMGAITAMRAKNASSMIQSESKATPKARLIDNPREAQLLAKFIATLPKTPEVGLYQCRSAGDNILHAPKTIHTRLDHNLNDFMLAMLDHQQQRIIIQVSTNY